MAGAELTWLHTRHAIANTLIGVIFFFCFLAGVLHFNDANLGYSTRLQNFRPTAWGLDLTSIWISEDA